MSRQKIWERRTKAFRVVLYCEEDYYADLSWADAETLEKIASGFYSVLQFEVAVYDSSGHEIGSDSLGGSVYENASDFIDHRACGRQNREYEAAGTPGRCGSYFADMVRSAIGEARKTYSNRAFLRAV